MGAPVDLGLYLTSVPTLKGPRRGRHMETCTYRPPLTPTGKGGLSQIGERGDDNDGRHDHNDDGQADNRTATSGGERGFPRSPHHPSSSGACNPCAHPSASTPSPTPHQGMHRLCHVWYPGIMGMRILICMVSWIYGMSNIEE